MKPHSILGVVIALLVSQLSSFGDNVPFTLPSGNKIEIIGMGQITNEKEPPSIMVKYQTLLNLDDRFAVRREADELWQRFVADVESAQVSNAIICVDEAPRDPNAKEIREYNLVLQKVNGKWVMNWPSSKDPQPKQVDDKLVNQYITLWDAAANIINVEGELLYMAPEWTGTITGPGPGGKTETKKIKLFEFNGIQRQLRAAVSGYQYVRTGTTIQISADKQWAKVRSTITQTITPKNGKPVTMISQVAQVLHLISGKVVFTSAEEKVVEIK